MINCISEQPEQPDEYGRCVCPNCERKLPCQAIRTCTGVPQEPPQPMDEAVFGEAAERLGISFDDVKHYAAAVFRWKAAGWPMRSQADVKRLYRDHCEECDDNIKGRCKRCGCHVSTSWIPIWNKPKMATEYCEKWPEEDKYQKASVDQNEDRKVA